jgi:tetratricopeptide (TPR) repeat protein
MVWVPGKRRMTSKIERLISVEDWPAARRAVRAELRSSPNDHWLLTRLGLTYYEERRYKQALKYSLRALEEAPNCPLALWDYAGSLEMLDQAEAALKVYLLLVHRGIQRIAFGDCGEGLAWARGLIADCHYRMAHCYTALRRPKMAIKSLKSHIGLRGPGCRSVYSLVEVREELGGLQAPLRARVQ